MTRIRLGRRAQEDPGLSAAWDADSHAADCTRSTNGVNICLAYTSTPRVSEPSVCIIRRPALTKDETAKPFAEPGFLCLIAGMFLLRFGIYVPITYLPVQAIAVGMSRDLAQYLVPMLNAARWAPLPSHVDRLAAQVSPVPEIGFRTGIVFLVSSVPGLTADPIAGAILEHSGGNSWTNLKVVSGVFCLAGTTSILGARVVYAGAKPTAVF
ncbi:hypothetical protein QBC46DRAFT_428897 [Diplogelasinospora grovesii]|uniref:Uncharacterized protein n=1 Tax=Diplogelasinospora grovesii TaxID=303347 RepID=A0AAN6NDZ0_9PEZI|nr:hypothetical protein QBC46DRAFT_428897 [Diplogelasinospora grovesii]